MTTLSIRTAETADTRAIAEIQVTAWQAAYRGLLPDETLDNLSVDASQARWKERLAGSWEHVLVAETERIVGFAACGRTRDDDLEPRQIGEIHVLYVHPDNWRHGYGRALLDECLRLLRADNFERVILWALRGNAQAIAFYEAVGFRADGASRVRLRADGTRMPVIRFTLALR